jgi:ABC-2 type transport system ATP-binding protein
MQRSSTERSPAAVVSVDGLRKRYGNNEAVRGVSFDVARGEIFGLIGPDGAGKTTVFHCLSGVMEPTAGRIDVLGLPVRAARPNIGYLTQQFSLNLDLSIDENARYAAGLRRVPRKVADERKTRYLKLLGLASFGDRLARALSGGMKQKLALACALIAAPELLLLDEPTTGVDPVSRRELWDVLAELSSQGTTIVVATPYLDEAERCHRIALMYDGRIEQVGTPAGVRGAATLEEVFIAEQRRRGGQSFHADFPRTIHAAQPARTGPAIEARALGKRFGDFEAVRSFDLAVKYGEIYGLLGANGAGKTTSVKMLCGLLQATSGIVRIAGESGDLRTQSVRRHIGYMSQKFTLYDDLTIAENLEFSQRRVRHPARPAARENRLGTRLDRVARARKEDDGRPSGRLEATRRVRRVRHARARDPLPRRADVGRRPAGAA